MFYNKVHQWVQCLKIALPRTGSTGNPRTKAAAESAVRLAKEARRKSARQSGGGKRGSSRKRSPPEIRAPSQPESAPRQRFAGNPHAKAAAEGVLLRRIAGERSSEQRIQRFEAGQARFAQRKKLAGKPCADLAGVRPAEGFCRGKERAEPAGACPAAAFRREATRGALGRPALRGWTILRSVESSGVRPSSGFSVSKPVRRGSSRGRASPGKNVPSQPELVLRQRFAGKPRAGQTILRSVESSGVRPSSGFSVSKPVRRGSSRGRASPGKNVPSQPELVLRQRFAGKPRAGQTILRSVESSGVRPSSGFSASKPVRRGSSSGRASPGSRAPEQRQRAFRFVESPENARPSSGFSASKPVRHGSSSGRSSPGSRAPERRQRAFCFVESPENARQSSGFSASKSVRRGSPRGRSSPGSRAPT